VPDQAEAAGEHRRTTEGLQDAGEDQHERVRGERAEHRGAGQQQRPGQERPATPVIVADRSAAQQPCGCPDVHRAEHPGLSTGSGTQACGGAYQRRQRCGERDENQQRPRRPDGEGAAPVGPRRRLHGGRFFDHRISPVPPSPGAANVSSPLFARL